MHNTRKPLADYLWGENAKPWLLVLAVVVMFFGMLGSHLLWTQEDRWANIIMNMRYSGDYFHPMLRSHEYYDKPLLSYWLMIGFSKLVGFNAWALRLPSAISGALTVYATYRLGFRLHSKRLGLIVAWLLVTTFYFVYWSREASADMLNVAGIMLAVAWYFEKRETPCFWNYFIFFFIVMLASLCKGIVVMACVGLVLLPDLLKGWRFKQHIRLSFFVALIAGLVVYVLPFIISQYISGASHYSENGLYEVYRENFVRYFNAWDNQNPVTTYFVALPVYTMPWFLLFIPAVFSAITHWKQAAWHTKWAILATVLLFMFFTVSQSRRYYYILPAVPFALMVVADWIERQYRAGRFKTLTAGMVVTFAVLLLLWTNVITPLVYQGGEMAFAKAVKQMAEKEQPWSKWDVVMLNPRNRIMFYLNPERKPKFVLLDRKYKHQPITTELLLSQMPVLNHLPPNTIFISEKKYVKALENVFQGYHVVYASRMWGDRLIGKVDDEDPVAYIP